MFDDDTQFKLVQSMAEIVTSNALATANLFEAPTKQTLSKKKAAHVKKKSKRAKRAKQTETPFQSWVEGANKFSASVSGTHNEDSGMLSWMTPDYWESVSKPGPSPLQTLAEPAFGSFAGLDWASPMLAFENKLPDYGTISFSSPADFFDPRCWIPGQTAAGAPNAAATMFTPFFGAPKTEPENPVEAFWGAWSKIVAQSMKPMMDMMMQSGLQAAQAQWLSAMTGQSTPMGSLQAMWTQPFTGFGGSQKAPLANFFDPWGLSR